MSKRRATTEDVVGSAEGSGDESEAVVDAGDADAPRVAQWVDEDELDDEEEEEETDVAGPSTLVCVFCNIFILIYSSNCRVH
jgi:hypothetical protein